MNNILLVEDDKDLGPAVKASLEREGFEVTLAPTISQAKEQRFNDFNLVLLDWMLPDGQGIDLLKEIQDIPVIMLTARNDLIDKVLGLEGGARDYITKPFEPRELLARIRVQLRDQGAPKENKEDQISSKDLVLNKLERTITYKGEELVFTKMEFDLLFLLMSTPNKVFTREKLLDEVWGYDNYPTTRTVDTHVLQIRQKISNDIIETVRGIGYKFNAKHL